MAMTWNEPWFRWKGRAKLAGLQPFRLAACEGKGGHIKSLARLGKIQSHTHGSNIKKPTMIQTTMISALLHGIP
jgi:hypothetical protein